MKVSSFIVTLAGMLYFRGISMIATNGATVAPLPPSLKQVATGFLPPLPSIAVIVAALFLFGALRSFELRRGVGLGVVKNFNADLFRGAASPVLVAIAARIWLASSKGIPYLIVLVAVCAIAADILFFWMRAYPFWRTALRYWRQSGSGPAGRHQRRSRHLLNFVIAGLAYGITGVALTARVSGAIAGSAGLFLELDAIAACDHRRCRAQSAGAAASSVRWSGRC